MLVAAQVVGSAVVLPHRAIPAEGAHQRVLECAQHQHVYLASFAQDAAYQVGGFGHILRDERVFVEGQEQAGSPNLPASAHLQPRLHLAHQPAQQVADVAVVVGGRQVQPGANGAPVVPTLGVHVRVMRVCQHDGCAGGQQLRQQQAHDGAFAAAGGPGNPYVAQVAHGRGHGLPFLDAQQDFVPAQGGVNQVQQLHRGRSGCRQLGEGRGCRQHRWFRPVLSHDDGRIPVCGSRFPLGGTKPAAGSGCGF